MILILDADVQNVAEFMQRSLPMDRLLAVASSLNAVAPVLWGDGACLHLRAEPIASPSRPSTRSAASESDHVQTSAGGDSVAGAA